MDKLIPFNSPHVPEISKRYVLEALEASHQQGDGPFTAKASKMLSELVGGGYVLLTPSCTHALEMASMLANIGPGDEVILPSFTFTSAATAVTKFGARPVFVDVAMKSKGIDVDQVREAITPRTKAISWVNYAGVAPDIVNLRSIANEFDLLLIEDNAHGLGGTYQGKPLGSFGDFATQSFHATKNIQCGEGGALVVNNPKFIGRAEIIREKGTDRSKFVRGEVQKYQWVDHGSSYLLAESLAAVLLGQFESFLEIQESRKMICKQFANTVKPFELLSNSDEANNVAHMFYIQFSTEKEALSFKANMRAEQVSANSHYEPLSQSQFAEMFLMPQRNTHVTNNIAKTLVRLPVWFGMKHDIIDLIAEATTSSLSKVELGSK